MKIKVISLWHPWALAMWKMLKQYETRSAAAPAVAQLRHYRGWLGIHAAQMHWLRAIDKALQGESIDTRKAFALKCIELMNDAPVDKRDYGCIGGICWFDGGIYQTQSVRSQLSETEIFFGDYSDGRRAIHCSDMIALEVPVPIRGHQGLFDWEVPEVIAEIIRKWEGVLNGRNASKV